MMAHGDSQDQIGRVMELSNLRSGFYKTIWNIKYKIFIDKVIEIEIEAVYRLR